MKIVLIALFVITGFYLKAQTNTTTNTQKPFKEGDSSYQAADFPGGVNEWIKYIERNLHPETPANHNAPVAVYKVVASFAIDSAGNVIDIQILEDPGYGTANDVIKLLKKSPRWLPATINDKPVIYRQKQNFTYQVTQK